jgi:precorrin-6Y C5,15-methyltransferase (decarboxylating)
LLREGIVTAAATNRRWLAILGIGEDGVEGLSAAARALVSGAELVVGGARHLALAAGLIRGEQLAWPTPLADAFPAICARRGRPVAVLASGDPFCYGVGNKLLRHVPAEETLCLPAPSAFSLACARLGWPLQDTATISFCGRPLETLAPLLQPAARILTLSADATTPSKIAAYLSGRGFGGSTLHVLEALGGASERLRQSRADAFDVDQVNALNLVGIEAVATPDALVIPLAAGLPDEAFEHDGQLTKREIRAVTLSSLAPRRGELLWDIGCGSGSIAIEWMLRHPANRAIGIEENPERSTRAARNAATLGAPAIEVITGAAPAALAGLPSPDAVFIGGGAQENGVIDTAWQAIKPGGRLVANSVTIETEAVLIGAQARLGGTLTRLSVERLDRIGTMHGYRPAMTVTQWSAVKP